MFRDREYLSSLLRIGLPIAAQNLISSSLNMISVLLIGQLGETAVAAVGLANQIFFLLNLLLFGISSGTAIFTAQYWGVGDVSSIRKVQGLGLGIALLGGVFFSIVALFFPEFALSLYSEDPAVLELGSQYLRVVGFSYLATAISLLYGAILRSTGNVSVPTAVSSFALAFGTALSYVLIFGLFGLPEMGVSGAALGTVIARLVEVGLILLITYSRRMPAAARPFELMGADQALRKKYFTTVLPVVANESLWSWGITIYNMIYAHISTESVAAVNIASTIENMAFVIFFGIANASAIMIGHKIGAGQADRAFIYARRALILAVGMAVVVGGTMVALSGPVLSLYNVSPEVALYARNIILVSASVLWIKVSNTNIVVGILRSGGDTRFSLFLDTGTVWLIGIPMAYIGAFVFHFPIYTVVLMIAAEELVKMSVGLYRFFSKKWIHNLARPAAPEMIEV